MVCGAARSAAAKILAYAAKSRAPKFLRMLKAKSTPSNPYVAKALKARVPSISPTIPACFQVTFSAHCIVLCPGVVRVKNIESAAS